MIQSVPIERLTPERRRELTRAALVQSAAEIFAERGFHAASLEEIAQAAGFTRGAIYSNFQDKEELLLAVLDHFSERQLAAFAGVLEESETSTSEERLEAAAAQWSNTINRDRTMLLLSLELRLYALRNPAFGRRLADLHHRQEERIAALVAEEAQRQGAALTVDPGDFAVIAWATSEGLQQLAAVDQESADRYNRLAQLFFSLVAEAILEAGASKNPRGRAR